VAAVVIAVVFYFWHRYQVRRNAAAIFDHAQALYAKEEWRGAADAFHRYLQFHPQDATALLMRAQAYDKLAGDAEQLPRTTSLFFQAIQANPQRHDIRLRLAELLFATRRYDEAAAHADKVLGALPDDLKAARLKAGALREQIGPAQRISIAEVVDSYQAGLSRHRGDIPLSEGLADLLRSKSDVLPARLRDTAVPTADATINRMVEFHKDNPEAYLARYRYATKYAIEDAEDDLIQAYKLDPDGIEVLLTLVVAKTPVDREAARSYGTRLLAVAPEDRRTYLTLAGMYVGWNQPEEAIETLKAGLKAISESDIDLNRILLQLYLHLGKVPEARAVLGRIEPAARRIGPYLPAPVRSRLGEDLIVAQAQLQILEGKTLQALPRLKSMASSVTEGTDPAETLAERQRRWRMLAGAYSRLGLFDLAGTAYDELVRLDPASSDYHLQAAAAWRQSGDIERCIKHYETAAMARTTSLAAWVGLIEARLDLQFRKNAAEARDWRGVEATLKQARNKFGDGPGIVLLEATLAIARNQRRKALEELQKLAANEDLEVAILPRLTTMLQDAGDPQGADEMLDRYRAAAGTTELVAITKSALRRRQGDTAGAIRVLEEAVADVPDPARGLLLRHLITQEIEAGRMHSARQRLRELRKEKSGELWVQEMAADMAILAGDFQDLQTCEEDLQALEGESGSYWRYYRAVRLLEAEKDDLEAVRKANPLLTAIQAIRPSWPPARLLKGRIAERMGRISEAADNYEIALRSGSRNLTAFQWLVATLYRQNRFADAAAYVRQVGQIATLTGDLSSQAIPMNLRAGRIDDALQVAQAAAELRPADPLAQVWFGQTLALADKTDEAERVLLKCIKLAPKDIRTWGALIWFYGRERRSAEARQFLAQVVEQVDMTSLERQLVLARGSELIGDRDLAERHYRQALGDHPKDVKLLEEVGRFYFKFDHDKAQAAFEKVLDLHPQSVEGRRAVSLLLGLRGSDEEWERAVTLFDQAENSTNDERRLHASLLLVRGGADNIDKAVALMGGVVADEEKPRAEDRWLLARAYESLQRIDDARAQIEAVLKENDGPKVLPPCIEFLIRNNRLVDARDMLSRLEEQDPLSLRTLDLTVEWLDRSQRADEIPATVDRLLAPRLEATRSEMQKSALVRVAVDLLTRTGHLSAAEAKLREFAPVLPEGNELLALWLARHDRFDDALAVCLDQMPASGATASAGASQAIGLIRVLTVAAGRSAPLPPRAAAARKAIGTTVASLRDGDSIQLLIELAVLREMEEQPAEAIMINEQVLARSPTNVVVLNNLAVLLAELPDRAEEALSYINRALAAFPNSPELLDSKALVVLGAKRYAEARDILERLCRANPRNGRYRLHLAFVLKMMDERGASHRELELARRDGIDNELLTPPERRLYQKVTGEDGPSRQD
jgi:tetratricopeptide (TPR) repeat protein